MSLRTHPAMRLPDPRRRHTAVLAVVALALLWLLAWVIDARAFFACWLLAWWTAGSIILGGQANLWLHDLTGGAWGRPLRPVWQAAAGATPWLLLGMVPLLFSVWAFYPWSAAEWQPDSARPAFQAAWLHPAFATARLLLYAAVWWRLGTLSQRLPTTGRGAYPAKGRSALALIAYGITVSLAGVDLIQSLMPQWHASGFGLIVLVMQMKLGFAFGVIVAASAPRSPGAAVPRAAILGQGDRFPPGLGRDWGNLLLMYVMMWAYLAYVQFLIIWAENLPAEIAWYVPRLQTAWVWLGGALVLLGFFVPLLLLLMRAIKQDRCRLRRLAWGLALAGWAESVWIIIPSIDGLGSNAVWMAPALTALFGVLLWYLRRPCSLRQIHMRARPLALGLDLDQGRP